MKTQAAKLMAIAYETYRRGEPEIAKDVFVLAMENPTAALTFGSTKSMQEAIKAAVDAGDFESARTYIAAMEDEEPTDEMLEDDDTEGALSPGDFVEAPPVPSLAPAQVASLLGLAREIKADGHGDLSGRITKALGLSTRTTKSLGL